MNALDGKKMYITGALLILLGLVQIIWPGMLDGMVEVGGGEMIITGLGMFGLKSALKKAGTGK